MKTRTLTRAIRQVFIRYVDLQRSFWKQWS